MDPRLKSIYNLLPPKGKDLMVSVYSKKSYNFRRGRFYNDSYNFLKKSQWMPNIELQDYQLNELKSFLTFSSNHSTFYRELFKKSGFDPYRLNSLTDLNELPVINKEVIRKNAKAIIADNLNNYKYVYSHTSGTTGQALIFPLSRQAVSREYAFRNLHYSWAGVYEGQKIAVCAGHPVIDINTKNPPYWAYDNCLNRLLLSSYHLSEKNIKYYLNELNKFKPDMLKGYPSSVYLLALANRNLNNRLHIPSVFTASETLFDFQREIIEDSFNAKVYNWYGTAEYTGNIVGCERGKLHMKLEHSYNELLNFNNEPARPGEEGRLICTAFGNYVFPLIRYEIGDIVILSDQQSCLCGRSGVIIDKIIGRQEDYIISSEGKLIGRLDHIFKDSLNIENAQIVQNIIDEVIIRIVPSDDYTEKDEKLLLTEAKNRLGDNFNIRIEKTDKLARSSSGKTKFIVSNIGKKSFLDQNIDLKL